MLILANNDVLVPPAAPGLNDLKYEVATELGYGDVVGQPRVTPKNFEQITGNMKYEIADELGLSQEIENGYWGNVSSRACGTVGGRIGGRIGGNMVRKMIQYAEQHLSR